MQGRRAGLAVGALVAVYVVALFVVRPVPDLALAMVGGPNGGIARHGGVRVRYQPPAGVDRDTLRDRMANARVQRDGDVLVVDVSDVDESQADEVRAFFTEGGLTMREESEAPTANDIANRDPSVLSAARLDGDPPRDAVVLDIDQWRPEAGGNPHIVWFLRANDPVLLMRTIERARAAGWREDPETEILLERVEWRDGQAPYWRTHEVMKRVEIDGSMVERATGADDPYSNRPIVLLDFTREGGERFCELTRRIVGRKLATVVGGRVRTSPIINGEICGGRASITMGGSNPVQQLRERDATIATLRTGALPPGGRVDGMEWQPRRDLRRLEWAARLFMGVLAGLLAGLVAIGLVRIVRPRWQGSAAVGRGAFPWRRVLVTLLAPLSLYGLRMLTLPGVNDAEVDFMSDRFHLDPTPMTVIALGIMPIVTAFVVVEVVAMLVPRWRRMRHRPLGRIALGKVTAVVTALFVVGQGFVVARALESMQAGGVELVDVAGWWFRLAVIGSLAAGTSLLAIVAGMIREHGLGNGYVALIVSGTLLSLGRQVVEGAVDGTFVLGVVTIAVVAVIAAGVLRWRVGRDGEAHLLVPSSGATPLSDGGGIGLVFALGSVLGAATLFPTLYWKVQAAQSHAWGMAALVIGSVAVWAWLFARPSLVADVAVRAQLTPSTRETWLRAALVSAVMLVACWTMARLATPRDATAAIANPLVGVLLGAAVLDALADLRARRGALEPAWIVHQVQCLPAVENALAVANIPCHLHASHARTLLAFFGPFVPVVVLVPAEHAIEARVRISALFE
ncbi:MAG TPA: hypothetical protein VFQ53_33685 [Kofleriaceae bacterium]|nr:hypothetical protein [Kofleriaceae bacterium]